MEKQITLSAQVQITPYIERWLSSRGSKNTVEAYHNQLKILSKEIDILKLSSFSMQDYISRCLQEGGSKASIRLRLSTIQSFLSYCIKQVGHPQEKLKLQFLYDRLRDTDKTLLRDNDSSIRHKVKRRVLSKEQIERLLQEVKNPTTYLLIFMLINTGARISELLSLEFYDIKKDNGEYVNFIRWENGRFFVCVKGKGSRIREFFINDKVSEVLIHHRPLIAGTPVMVNQKGERLTRNGAYRLLKDAEKKYLQRANLYKFSCHSFRHCYISFQRANKVDSSTISKVVGNSPAMIDKVYDHSIPDINDDFCVGLP